MKDEYLAAVKAVGFQDVSIVNEIAFPIKFMLNDPTAKAIIKDLAVSPEEIEGVANSVVSIKVQGVKPN